MASKQPTIVLMHELCPYNNFLLTTCMKEDYFNDNNTTNYVTEDNEMTSKQPTIVLMHVLCPYNNFSIRIVRHNSNNST
jgi:hypothetical protein